MQAVSLANGQLTLAASTRLTKERVISQYLDKLRLMGSSSSAHVVTDIEIILRTSQSVQRAHSAPRLTEMPFTEQDTPNMLSEKALPDIAAGPEGFDARFTFDNFVVAKPNDLAYAAARRAWPNQMM